MVKKFSEQIAEFEAGTVFSVPGEAGQWIRTDEGYRFKNVDDLDEGLKALATITGNPTLEFPLAYAEIFDQVQDDSTSLDIYPPLGA